jgi:DnaJ family protein C protein 19
MAAKGSSVEWKRYYRMTPHQDSALIVGGLTLLATGVVAQRAYGMYVEYEANKAKPGPVIDQQRTDSATGGERDAAEAKTSETKAEGKSQQAEAATSSWGSSWFARNFYEGGFEDKMTKREAALILGVRESASPERIKDAHRRILLINHPDRGGSAFIAAKINEAKDLLLKSK